MGVRKNKRNSELEKDIKVYWSDEDQAFIAEHKSGLKTHGDTKKEAIKEMLILLEDEELYRLAVLGQQSGYLSRTESKKVLRLKKRPIKK